MYIFTDLVPTSLKAGKDDCVLYVPTETSGVHKQSESNVLLTEYQVSFVRELRMLMKIYFARDGTAA